MRRIMSLGAGATVYVASMVILISSIRGHLPLGDFWGLIANAPRSVRLWVLLESCVAVVGLSMAFLPASRTARWTITRVVVLVSLLILADFAAYRFSPRSFGVEIGSASWDTYWVSDFLKVDVVVMSYLLGVICAGFCGFGLLVRLGKRIEEMPRTGGRGQVT